MTLPHSGLTSLLAGPGGWHYRRSLASRVTLLTTLAVGVTIAAVAVGVYAVLRVQLQANLDDSLIKRAHSVASDAAEIGAVWQGSSISPMILHAGDIQIGAIRSDGWLWMGSQDDSVPEPGAPELAVAQSRAAYSIRTVSTKSGIYRMVSVPVQGQSSAVVLAQSMQPQERMYKRLGLVVLLFGGAGVIVAGFAGWGVATGGLRPVRRLTYAMERVARTEDLQPLRVEGDDEVASLARSFNRMLAALAASRDRQRQLVADASHELRTPLTSLRTNIELLTQADASISGEQRAELMGDIRAQIDELTTLIGDLTELARDEPPLPVVESVDLADIVDQALARVRLRAPSLGYDVRTTSWWVIGDAASLERAVTNLLDNAAKWSPEGGTVHVHLEGGTLTVDDEGPGIADADLPHVFDRFYRSAESRAMPGSGLGLAIVRQVAERSGGTIEAGRAPSGGARLSLRIPGSPSPMPRTSPTSRPTRPSTSQTGATTA